MGASVAALVAAMAPELLRALILEEPAPNVLSEESWQVSSAYRRLHDLLLTHPSAADLMAAERQQHPASDDAELRASVKSLLQMDPDIPRHVVDFGIDQEVLGGEVLPKITCPVLLVLGNPVLGGIVEDRHVQHSHALLADCTYVRLSDAGHGPHTTHPVQFTQIVTNYLESL
jgi:pimeloyl-ACP methyl ester carboxylesterase